MVQDMEPLICLKCGYALRGLPARKCGDCGHVYLRCPECGTSQIANEAQNRMLLQMRARAARLPGRAQVGQMVLLVAVGVLWILTGFIVGLAHKEVTLTSLTVLAATAALSASLLRLIVLHLQTRFLSAMGSALSVTATFVVGLVFSTALTHDSGMLLLAPGMVVLIGAVAGSAGAVVTGWLLLWLFARDADRVLLGETYSRARGRRLPGSEARKPARHLMFCTHCAAELPPLSSGTCNDCGLQQIACPACGRHCGISDALGAMVDLGQIMRSISAGARVAARLVAGVVLWIWLGGLMVRGFYSYNSALLGSALLGPFAGFVWIPRDLLTVSWMMLVVMVLRWFVFVRGTVAATGVITLAVLLAGWSAAGPNVNGRTQSAILVLTVASAGASLVASLLRVLVKAVLPRRRVAMLEQVMPELAREDAENVA